MGVFKTNMAVKEKQDSVSEELEWNVDTEVQLFYSMHGHKPVGVNKYFHMLCIFEKFHNLVKKELYSKVIWDHLDTMYDMQALDDTENLPFPNNEVEFSLPDSIFGGMIKKRNKQDELTKKNNLIKKGNLIKKDNLTKKDNLANLVGEKEVKSETPLKKDVNKSNNKELKKDSTKDSKESLIKKEPKESNKEGKRDSNDGIKELKKVVNKELKESRKESKDIKEGKKTIKEIVKEIKKEIIEIKEKIVKPRGSIKEKKEIKVEVKEEIVIGSTKKDRVKELSEAQMEDSPKRGSKRSTRGSIKSDDTSSNKSSSPITAATPPPSKRRRT